MQRRGRGRQVRPSEPGGPFANQRSNAKVSIASPGPDLRPFERVGLLVGSEGLQTLARAHVLVLGLGGVGSWAAEALARSGVGRLTLVDFDRVCPTNTNRQLAALSSTVGQPKCQVLAERLRQVNPGARIESLEAFYGPQTADGILGPCPDYVLDAIDHITSKCHLLATCRQRGIPVVTCTGAAGRMDPTRIRVADLARTRVDPLALAVRKILRIKYGFHPKKAFRIPAVFSDEDPTLPPGFKPEPRKAGSEGPSVVYGTASFVTGAFGLVAASLVVRGLLAGPAAEPPPSP